MTQNQFETLKFVLESLGYLLSTVVALCCAYLHLVLYYTVNKASEKLRTSFNEANEKLRSSLFRALGELEDTMREDYMPRELAIATFVRKA